MGIITWLAGLGAAKLIALFAAIAATLVIGFITGKKIKQLILKYLEKHKHTVVLPGSVIKTAIESANHGINNIDILDDDVIIANYDNLDTDDDILDIEKLRSNDGIASTLQNAFDTNNNVLIFDKTSI